MIQLNHFTQLKDVDIASLAGHYHVAGQSYDETKRNQLQNVAYTLRYAIPQPEGPAELTNFSVPISDAQMKAWSAFGTWRNGSTFTYGEFVTNYHRNPKNTGDAFFLHGPDGKRLRSWQDSGKRPFYLLSIGYRPAAEQWWRDVKSIHDRYGWKHVLVDNVGVDAEKIRETLQHVPAADRVAAEYKGQDQDQAYQDAWVSFGEIGRLIMGPDVLILGNFIGDYKAERDLSKLLAVYDGMLREAFGIGWLNTRKSWTPADTLRSLQQTWTAVDAGKHVLCNVQLAPEDSAQFRAYCFALYLMVAGEHSSFRMTYGTTYGIPPVKVPEMDLDLGEPTAPFSGTSKLTRPFANYVVIADPSTQTAQFIKREQPAPQPPEPADPIVLLKQEVESLKAARQADQALLADVQARLDAQSKTVALLEQRLSREVVIKF